MFGISDINILFHWQLLYVKSLDHLTIQNLAYFQPVHLRGCFIFGHVLMKHHQHLKFHYYITYKILFLLGLFGRLWTRWCRFASPPHPLSNFWCRLGFAIKLCMDICLYTIWHKEIFDDVTIFLLKLSFLKLGVENWSTSAYSIFCSNILLNMALILLFACCMHKKTDFIEKNYSQSDFNDI